MGRCDGYFANRLQRVFVEEVLSDALYLLRIEIIEAGVKIDRDDGRFFGDENRFRLPQQAGAAVEIGLLVGLAEQVIVAWIFPAGAIVATIAQVKVKEGVSIVVVANPTGSRDVVVEARLRAVEDFALDLTEFDFN